MRNIYGIFGVSESTACYAASGVIKKNSGKTLVITATEGRARSVAGDLSFFAGRDVHLVPEEDRAFLSYDARDREQVIGKIDAMHALRTDDDAIVVAPVSSAIKKVMPHDALADKDLVLKRGEDIDYDLIREKLAELGYERLPLVEGRGSYSLRGDIIDIYTPEGDDPYRIEFFDTSIESIRSFDIDTQRSKEDLSEITIRPCEEIVAGKDVFDRAARKVKESYDRQIERLSGSDDHVEAVRNLTKKRDKILAHIDGMTNMQLLDSYIDYFFDDTEYLWDYMQEGTVIIDDPSRINEFLKTREEELRQDFETMLARGEVVPEDESQITGKKDFEKVYKSERVYVLAPFTGKIDGISEYAEVTDLECRQMTSFNGKMDLLEEEIKRYNGDRYSVTLVVSTDERKKNLSDFMIREDLVGRVSITKGTLSQGIVVPGEKLCYISDSDIFGETIRTRRSKGKKRGTAIRDFSELSEGDYVVHENRGIGKFLGISRLTIEGEDRDYLKIKYAGQDMLYVPVERFDLVQKYIGSEGAAPKLSKLGGNEWKSAKRKARQAIAEMADELIDLYARRKMKKGFAFDKDDVFQQEFEDLFPFQETDDQLRCTEEIKRDMEKPEAMDRLLLGDVGFGKTEVASRAICKCVLSGKQAAVLVPTTLLANQHYYTLKERFSSLPTRVEMMSRFKTEGELKKIAKDISEGAVDIVIGTHRLLSKDVEFKDLGLLVVDEEQRFGVQHKERIKELKENVDVLTLSATPIPRTLNMSLSGIKDMSLISEPPEERYPVQTYVMEQSESMIREAILREKERGGQVFIVYNRVRGINLVAKRIQDAVPEARVAVGHGQMNEHSLENVMMKFVDHEVDVLIATTIIESGIDIQNANTLIVLDSDRFGLAQLYQLRGRVGRSNRIAYAYFMYDKDKVLTEVAEKRLRAIREFTEFGSGFKVAMRDLELRGAGNLLGSEQSGHMMSIGYELYCKLVDEQVRKLKGEHVDEDAVEAQIELHVKASIPEWYMEDEKVKLDMYKRISYIRTSDEESDIIDELKDRFGEVPKETLNLIKVARIKGLADSLHVKRIYEQPGSVVFSFDEKAEADPEKMVLLSSSFGKSVLIHGGRKPYIKLGAESFDKLDRSIKLLGIMKGEEENAV